MELTSPFENDPHVTELRQKLEDGEGVIICIDESNQLLEQGGLQETDVTRVHVSLNLTLALNPAFDLKSNIVVENDINSLVRHLKHETPHVVFVDDAKSMFDSPWGAEDMQALELNRHVVILSIPSIWMLPEEIMNRVGFRLRIDNRRGSASLWRSPYERED